MTEITHLRAVEHPDDTFIYHGKVKDGKVGVRQGQESWNDLTELDKIYCWGISRHFGSFIDEIVSQDELALDILYHYFGDDEVDSSKYHKPFADDVLSKLDPEQDFFLTTEDIDRYFHNDYTEEVEKPTPGLRALDVVGHVSERLDDDTVMLKDHMFALSLPIWSIHAYMLAEITQGLVPSIVNKDYSVDQAVDLANEIVMKMLSKFKIPDNENTE